MNPRERVRLALTCRRPDRIPKALGFFPVSRAETAPVPTEDYLQIDVRFARFVPLPEQDDFRRYLATLPEDVHLGDMDQLRTYHEWDYHPESEPDDLPRSRERVEATLERLVPTLTDPSRSLSLPAQVRAWHDVGWAVAGAPPHLGGKLFEAAYRLRGFQRFLLDLATSEPWVHYLLDQLTELLVHNVRLLAHAGVDVLLLDDDVAMPTGLVISPAMWRHFLKPRYTRAIRAAREVAPDIVVFYHSDGDFSALLPDLIDVGVQVINPVQPDCMDALAIKRAFGDRLALWGTVRTANLWVRGTPDQIRREVKHRVETLGPEGLLLAPTYDLDDVPFANIAAFCEAADTYGRL
jgi:uroporphyrinogen decarboxylase